MPTSSPFRDRIRAVGLRATTARVAVLACIDSAGRPLCHAEVLEALGPSDRWDRATVFRNLSDLTDAGLLRRLDVGDKVWRYELLAEAEASHDEAMHPHFVCTTCGDVQCLDDVSISVQTGAAVPQSVALSKVRIQLAGVCDACD